MKIVHAGVEIVPTESGAYVGGLVKNVVTLCSFQKGLGHSVDVLTTDVRHNHRRNGNAPFARVRTIPTSGTYGSMRFAVGFARGATREIREEDARGDVDLVHVHSAYASFGLMAYRLRGLHAPLVFSLYSPNFRSRPGHDCNGSTFESRPLARLALRRYDAIVVPSHNLRERAVALGVPNERIVQIPPAVDPVMFDRLPSKAEARERLGIPKDRPVVLFVGNYSPWKGVEDLLVAMRRVRTRSPDALLAAAWGEPYEWGGNRQDEVLGLVRQLGLQASIREIGISRDIRTVYRAADVLVAPFHCTCKVLDYPLSILEAMACGTPVVATSVGGIPEIIGRNERGLLVPPRDPEALAQAIEAAIGRPHALFTMARRGIRWVRERVRPEIVAREVEALYASVSPETTAEGDALVPIAS